MKTEYDSKRMEKILGENYIKQIQNNVELIEE